MAPFAGATYSKAMLLELGIIALAVGGFLVLDLYVLGCERV
jgi:hypothetical protein